MKVDSNTKGNTYWFYFAVEGFRSNVRYTFNIFNFTRSMEKFYREGMNVLTKAERNSNVDEAIKRSCTNSRSHSKSDISKSPNVQRESNRVGGDKSPKISKPHTPKTPKTPNSPNEVSGEWRYGEC